MTDQQDGAAPEGDVYDWYNRGMALLAAGSADAAAQLLARVHEAEPALKSVREGLARALFNARRYTESAATFRSIVTDRPDDDYARYGLGMALSRMRRHEEAVEHLALAAAMRPDREDYTRALHQVRATLRWQRKDG